MPSGTLLIFVGILGALCPYSVAYGEEDHKETEIRSNGLTWNPLVPMLAQIASGDLEEEGSLINAGLSDFNLRFQRRVHKKTGFTLQAEYTQLSLFTRTTYVGIRGGPRFFFHSNNLKGWSATPFATLGRSSITAGTYSLGSWFVCGAGSEFNYTFFWGPMLMELGLGGYFTQNVGYTVHAESMKDTTAPDSLIQWKPLLTMGVGYAF